MAGFLVLVFLLCEWSGCNLSRSHKDVHFSNRMYPWLENFISCCFVCVMVFHSTSSGATHTPHFFLPSLFLFSFLSPTPLPSPTNALTPTRRRTQVLTNHLRQICWSLCTQIKLMTSCVRSRRTVLSSYHCSSLQYPAPKPVERSMIYQGVSVALARGWFTNTKRAASRRELRPQVMV